MMKLLSGSFLYKGYLAEIHEFNGIYYGKINFNGIFESFQAKSDTEALDKVKQLVNSKS